MNKGENVALENISTTIIRENEDYFHINHRLIRYVDYIAMLKF